MRITSFHVDGFGALACLGEEELAPGLVVVHGPNEAGKSTLFDFLTGVLFGFPQRRDNPRFHAPVRGGRHGGRVSFVDDSGGEWVVERHAGPQGGLQVKLPGGGTGDERDLGRVLAGASPTLFRAVFAIGIDDLRQLDTLTTDEVREVLFSSSIFGQRRSATKAIKQLSDARDDLARPRREDARANRLARALLETRAEMATARREMASFGELSRRAAEAEERVADIRERSRLQRARERQLDLLMTCWKSHTRAESSRALLAALESPPAGAGPERSSEALLRLEPELQKLAAQVSGHRERRRKLAELQHQRERLASSVQRRLARLGPGWTAERLGRVTQPELLAERARAARHELAQLSSAQATAAAILEEAERGLREVASERQSALAESPGALRPAPGATGDGTDSFEALASRRAEIDTCRRAVNELRERMAELDEARAAILGAGLSRPGVQAGGPDPGRGAALAMALAAIVLGGFAAALVAARQPVLGTLSAVVAVMLSGVVLATARRPGAASPPATGPASAADGEAEAEAAEIARRARDDIAYLARRLGLAAPPSKVDVERLDIALQGEGERAGRLEEHALARQRAEDRVSTARHALEVAARQQQAAEFAFATWRREWGFEEADTPDSVLEAVASVVELQDDLEGLGRIAAAAAGLEQSVADFSAQLQRLRFIGPEQDTADDEAGWPEERLEERLTFLVEAAAAARHLDHRRTDLAQEVSRAEAEVNEALGSGEAADRLRRELMSGQVLSWRQELDELEAVRESLGEAEEEALREHQSMSEAMANLATSDRVISLGQRQAALEDELGHVLDEYLVLGTARALLRRTLSLHERERQPAVIAKAASHFERVTAGRYVGLLPSAGSDGRQSIRVAQADGSTVEATDLSRGTIEQLYLCLRLGLADSFAERAVSLPVLLDDVLVNFDPARAQAVATELASAAAGHQIILFTCHPHLAELALKASSEGPVASQLVELSRL
jgi:uncharacterized protein YhaN